MRTAVEDLVKRLKLAVERGEAERCGVPGTAGHSSSATGSGATTAGIRGEPTLGRARARERSEPLPQGERVDRPDAMDSCESPSESWGLNRLLTLSVGRTTSRWVR